MKKIIFLFLIITNAHSLLKIDINKQGVNSMLIAVADFSGFDNQIATIISNDLTNSGKFDVIKINALNNVIDFSNLKSKKIEAVVFGDLKKLADGSFDVRYFVYDIWTKQSLIAQKFNIGNKISRRVSHVISDKIHFAILGENGFFDTSIAYVSVNKKDDLPYKLEVVDSDGFNPQVVIASKESIMSPSWSPDNKRLAYVSFISGRSRVYIQNILDRVDLKTLPIFDGIASSPSWHPNGNSLLLTLSKNNNQDIYQYFLDGRLKRITKNLAIDTEASFSADGKYIVWTSNRNGSAQIYLKNTALNSVKMLKIDGHYNVAPSFSLDGKKIILIHSDGGAHKVAEFEIVTNDLVILTDNYLDESPSFAPNSKMVIYSYSKNNRSYLSAVSTDGNYSFKLSDGIKQVREPVWSGFLQK